MEKSARNSGLLWGDVLGIFIFVVSCISFRVDWQSASKTPVVPTFERKPGTCARRAQVFACAPMLEPQCWPSRAGRYVESCMACCDTARGPQGWDACFDSMCAEHPARKIQRPLREAIYLRLSSCSDCVHPLKLLKFDVSHARSRREAQWNPWLCPRSIDSKHQWRS